MKLTQKTVETAIYEGRSYMSKSGRKRWSQHVLWDDGLPGLGLRITPTNRKSFIVSYRSGGRKRTKNLGAAGRLKLDEARRRAAELLASVAEEQPGEPTGHPSVEGLATVAQLADAYLEQHLKSNVPSWYADQRLIQIHVKPAMGRSLIAEVTQTDLANLRNRVGKRFPADGRRLAALLTGMFDWAAARGLWSKSSRGEGPAGAASPDTPHPEAEPEAEPAPPATAAELQESLERSEAERRDLAASLDEVSASGAAMLAKLGEQSTALEKLERELALSRRELERTQAASAGRPVHEETEKQMANLRQSVDQLMASLREARGERREMAEKLAAVEAKDGARAEKTAALMRRRNDLEAQLLDQERQIAIFKSQRQTGAGRIALWMAAGAAAGALLVFVAVKALGPGPTATPVLTDLPGATAAVGGNVSDFGADGSRAPDPVLGSAGGAPPAAAEPGPPTAAAATDPAGAPPNPTGERSPAGSAPAESGPDFAAAEVAVRSWAAAWSAQRVDDYLAAYSKRFVPPDGLGHREWASRRRNRILRPASIQVTLGDLRRTALDAERVRFDFEQAYETESYADTVRKTLELVWEDGGWKIASERAR